MSSSTERLIGEIRAIFAEGLAIEVESPAVDLLDSGLVDSVTLVELLLELEKRFDISLPLEQLEMEDFRSVARIADLIARTRPANADGIAPRSGGVAAPMMSPPGGQLPETTVQASGAAA